MRAGAKQDKGNDENKALNTKNIGPQDKFGALLDLLRIVSLEVVEAIVQHVQAQPSDDDEDSSMAAYDYEWKGKNYLLKMLDDSDFLAEVPSLQKWLGFKLYRNPFLCPDGLPLPQRDMPTSSTAIALAKAEAAEAVAAGHIIGMENYKGADERWAKRIWRASTILLHVESSLRRSTQELGPKKGRELSLAEPEVEAVAGNIVGSAQKARRPKIGGVGYDKGKGGQDGKESKLHGKNKGGDKKRPHENYLNGWALSQMNGEQHTKTAQHSGKARGQDEAGGDENDSAHHHHDHHDMPRGETRPHHDQQHRRRETHSGYSPHQDRRMQAEAQHAGQQEQQGRQDQEHAEQQEWPQRVAITKHHRTHNSDRPDDRSKHRRRSSRNTTTARADDRADRARPLSGRRKPERNKRRPLSAESLLHSHHQGQGHHHGQQTHAGDIRPGQSPGHGHGAHMHSGHSKHHHKGGSKYGMSKHKAYGHLQHAVSSGGHQRPKSANIAISALHEPHPLASGNSSEIHGNNQQSTSKLRRRIQRARMETQKLEEQLEMEQQLALDMRASEFDDDELEKQRVQQRRSSTQQQQQQQLAMAEQSATMMSTDSMAELSKITNLCNDVQKMTSNLNFEGLKAATSGLQAFPDFAQDQRRPLAYKQEAYKQKEETVAAARNAEGHRKHKGATKLQSMWRGNRVRDAEVKGGVDEYGDNALMQSVRSGKFTKRKFKHFVAGGGFDLNAFNYEGQTALHLAAMCTSDAKVTEVVRLLISHGADVEYKDGAEHTPLISAAAAKSAKGVHALVAQGADVHAVDGAHKSALMHALEPGESVEGSRAISCARELLKAGVDVNAFDADGCSCLHHCAIRGEHDGVKLLLSAQVSLHRHLTSD
jgi:hypothetical protein